MKGILKTSTFALGFLALASCTTDDFLGNSSKNGKKELIVSVEAPNLEYSTRAAFVPNTMQIVWQKGDQFRVSDEIAQKYDIFEFDGSAITIVGEAEVGEHKKALFPEKFTYKSGWDRTNGVTATMHIEKEIVLADPVVEDGKTAYVSALPMWGDVQDETAEQLKVKLSYLSAYTDITVYKEDGQPKAKFIRVLALNEEQPTAPTDNDLDGKLDEETPLSGYFDAQLKDGGVLVPDFTNEMTGNSYQGIITIDMQNNTADEAHVYIPIVPATYKYLAIQYSLNGENWTDLKSYKNQQIPRNALLQKDLVIGTSPKTARAATLKELEEVLATTDGDQLVTGDDYLGANEILEVELDGVEALETTREKHDLNLPDKSFIANVKGTIGNNTENMPLEITGGGDGKTIILNIEGGIIGNDNIIIKVEEGTTLVLGGEYASSNSTYKTIQVDNKAKVQFGYGAAAPFNTEMDILVTTETSEITVDGGSIANIDFKADASATGNITVKSGTVKNIGQKQLKNVPVTVNAGASVENIATGSKVEISGEVGTLKLNAANQEVVLTGGTDNDTNVAKLTTLNVNNKASVQISSTGRAVLLNVTGPNSSAPVYTSTWNGDKIAVTEINANGEIYTAAQLGGLTEGKAYKLMATVTVSGGKWTPVALNGNFNGNSLTITGLDAALFSEVKGGKIEKLTLTNVVINNRKADQGALAQVVNGTVEINTVTVNGTTTIGAATGDETTKNIGGLVGRAKGTVTLVDNIFTGTVKGYANVGGHIGNFEGGTLTYAYSKNTQTSTVNFEKTYKPQIATDMNCGTFGNFIGSITNAASTVKINRKNESTAEKFDRYFTADNIDKTALEFSKNKRTVDTEEEVFIGMEKQNHEIGYCPVEAITELVLYSIEKDNLNVPIKRTIKDDVNIYE